jgi:diguanylate cyclase (GGDEF)-like protein
MPQPGEPARVEPSAEDTFLDLLVETLEGLEESVRAPFLQRFFRTFTQIEMTETQAADAWSQILARQREFSEALGRRVALKTALVDVLGASHFHHVPVLLEYDAYRRLQINAATDGLTGLYNRRLFDETCEKELNRAKRYSGLLAVVLFDLHRLKEINDKYGHRMGDQVLQLAANNLRKTLRASDFAFRIGGDEFAMVLPQTDPEQAATLCRRVRNHFENEVEPLQMKVAATLDFGMAVYPKDADTKEDLVQRADERLYALKTAAKSQRVVIPVEAAPASPAPSATPTAGPREIPFPRREVPAQTPHVPQTPAPAPVQPQELTPAPAPSPVPTPAPTPIAAPGKPKSALRARKWERVSLSGTKSYALIDVSMKKATVIDLSYGGVALLFDSAADLPSQFTAVLHVPILPPLRVSLRKTYEVPAEGGRVRMGCSFVS